MEDIRYRYKTSREINVTIPKDLGKNLFRYAETWSNKISGIAAGTWNTLTANPIGRYRVVIVRRTG